MDGHYRRPNAFRSEFFFYSIAAVVMTIVVTAVSVLMRGTSSASKDDTAQPVLKPIVSDGRTNVFDTSQLEKLSPAKRNWVKGATFATLGQSKELLKLLKEDPGVATRTTSDFGMTLLHWACMYDQVGTAEILLNHGADVTAKEGFFRETPLHVAAKHDSLKVVKLLLDHGVDINILGDGPRPPHKPPLPEYLITPEPYSSPLDLAAAAGSERVVALLLEREAKLDVNPKKSAFSALHRAMGGWYNVRGYGNFKREEDPSTRAATGNRKVIEMLLAHGASLDDKDFNGSKPFHTGVCRLACDSVDYLLENHGDEIDVNEPELFERTPLQLVLNAPRNEEEAAKTMLKLLLKHGADVNATAGPGYIKVTAFEYARENKWGESVLELLRPPK